MDDVLPIPPAVLVSWFHFPASVFSPSPHLAKKENTASLTKSQSSSGKFQEDENIINVHF